MLCCGYFVNAHTHTHTISIKKIKIKYLNEMIQKIERKREIVHQIKNQINTKPFRATKIKCNSNCSIFFPEKNTKFMKITKPDNNSPKKERKDMNEHQYGL